MSMAVSSFKGKGHSDKECAQLLISGFSGMVNNWWNNYLNQEESN